MLLIKNLLLVIVALGTISTIYSADVASPKAGIEYLSITDWGTNKLIYLKQVGQTPVLGFLIDGQGLKKEMLASLLSAKSAGTEVIICYDEAGTVPQNFAPMTVRPIYAVTQY
jgi:hypothetical protein